jgi:hypothetical protein
MSLALPMREGVLPSRERSYRVGLALPSSECF